MITVLKLGGELLEDQRGLADIASAVASLALEGPLVLVHGGGRAIDAELRARGLSPRLVDGLRITDAPTLDVVVAVLAGRTNTALVASLAAAGVRAVGLTGADDALAVASPVPPIQATAGGSVDLGLVGEPGAIDTTLLRDLLRLGYVPVVASICTGHDGALLNVNADTFAARLAGALGAERLLIAGTTAGVLDASDRTIRHLPLAAADAMMASRVVHSGMVAKLKACRAAVEAGVREVAIVSGQGLSGLSAAHGTWLTRQDEPAWANDTKPGAPREGGC